eukprot:GHVT01013909.1.p1 GENE.GHVT01013909.1~~GHVT01013909.1.p1  ORF type:complete len:348 (+),score=26.84 GHVT01013909.1:700-1743(+)
MVTWVNNQRFRAFWRVAAVPFMLTALMLCVNFRFPFLSNDSLIGNQFLSFGPYFAAAQVQCGSYPPPSQPSGLQAAFFSQPDSSKVYLHTSAINDPAFINAGITKFASVFGVRVLGGADVDSSKIVHAAAVLAEMLDPRHDGRPINMHMVSAIRDEHMAMMAVLRDDATIEKAFAKLPPTYACFIYLLPEVQNKINPRGSAEANCDTAGRAFGNRWNGTVAYVSYFVTNAGYPHNFPPNSEAGRALKQAFAKAKVNGWFVPGLDSSCDHACEEMTFHALALTSALGHDQCTCRKASQWKLCTPQEMREKDPELYGTLTGELKTPNGSYRSSAVARSIFGNRRRLSGA